MTVYAIELYRKEAYKSNGNVIYLYENRGDAGLHCADLNLSELPDSSFAWRVVELTVRPSYERK